jgi:hypothetical protein
MKRAEWRKIARQDKKRGWDGVIIYHAKTLAKDDPLAKVRDGIFREAPQVRLLYNHMKDPTIELDTITGHVRIYEDGERD